METTYKPTLKDKLKAILKGGLVGGVLTSFPIFALAFLMPIATSPELYLSYSHVLILLFISCVASFFWFLGLIITALPFWYLFENVSSTSKKDAIFLGMGLSGIFSVFLLVPIGALVGWYIWNQTYGKALKSQTTTDGVTH